MDILFQSLKYNVLRNDLQSLKSSVDLLTKSVSAIVAKVISPQTQIPASFLSPQETTATSELTPSISTVVTSPSTSSIMSCTVTVGSDPEILDNSFQVQSSPVGSAHVKSWLSSQPPITPSSDLSETDSISSQINPPRREFSGSTTHPDLLTSEEIKETLQKSTSRGNFATNLTRILFDERTRITSNVSGRNKKQLNPAIMNYIKATTFKYYPCLPNENKKKQWSLCIIAIDEASRRLINKPRKR